MLGKADSQVSEFKDYGSYIERNKKMLRDGTRSVFDILTSRFPHPHIPSFFTLPNAKQYDKIILKIAKHIDEESTHRRQCEREGLHRLKESCRAAMPKFPSEWSMRTAPAQ